MKVKKGFTLIELLVVIAIIGILAAIAFPVFARAKDGSFRSSDLSNMNVIRTALQLYRVDQGGYPPQILGYATLYQSGPLAGQVVPAEQITGPLYPRRVENLLTFKPSYERANSRAVAEAVWPSQDPRAVGSAPILDLNGDGQINASDDTPEARQAFGPGSGFVAPGGAGVVGNAADAARFYRVSGYDVSTVDSPTGRRTELRYTLFWTSWGIGGGNASDDPRQLGYSDPHESTVITWNSFFRDYENGVPKRQNREIVLFLGGSARSYDSVDVSQRSWRVMPR
jgi:prepilin-type N-terminal cleavage/methylation domain-containing protein